MTNGKTPHDNFFPAPEEIEKEVELSSGLRKKGPLVSIASIALLIIFVVTIIPLYSIKVNPEPRHVPSLEDILGDEVYSGGELVFDKTEYSSRTDILKFMEPEDPFVKYVADRVVTGSCEEYNKICFAKALFYFVQDNLDYVNDPTAFEYVKTAKESLINQGGDCDDASVLLANLMGAVGIRSRFVFVPGHVFIQIMLTEAPERYKEGGWINLDATCQGCSFGEVSWKYSDDERLIVG